MEIYTILLITSDKSGGVMAMLQSSHSPLMPRIVIAGSSDALTNAWKEQQNSLIFYNRVCTFLPYDHELLNTKKLLNIEDGFYDNKKKAKKCKRCGGGGGDPYYISECRKCGGTGEINSSNNTSYNYTDIF